MKNQKIIYTMTTLITMIQKILKYLLPVYYLAIPLIYYAYIIYRRVFLVYLPRELFIPLSWWQMFFILLAIGFLILRVKALLLKEGFLTPREPKTWIFIKINEYSGYLVKHIRRISYNFYHIIVSKRKFFYLLLIKFAKILFKLTAVQAEILYLSLEILPKLLVLIIFFVDIIVFKQFYYFYRVLGLLLLPLLINAGLSIISRFWASHEDPMIDSFTSKPIPGSDLHEFCFKDPKEGYLFIKDIDDFIENHFIHVFNINYLLLKYYFTQAYYYFDRINLIITVMYIIGWLIVILGSFIAI